MHSRTDSRRRSTGYISGRSLISTSLAIDAAGDAMQAGHEAQVWVKDRSALARVF
jgi:hypothetical protein